MRAATDSKVSAAAGGGNKGDRQVPEDLTPLTLARNRNDHRLAARIRRSLRGCSPHAFHAYAALLRSVQQERDRA